MGSTNESGSFLEILSKLNILMQSNWGAHHFYVNDRICCLQIERTKIWLENRVFGLALNIVDQSVHTNIKDKNLIF